MHDYQKDAASLRRHLDDTIHTRTYSMGDMAHLGGAAALLAYLDGKHHGAAKMVKRELKSAVDYLYYYETTKNPLYHTLAWDAVTHVRQLCEDIEDTAEKGIACDLLEEVRLALESLPAATGVVTAGNPY